MRLRLWGTRGSVATPDAANSRYGGNTPCVEVRADDGELLILDAGIGLHWLGDELMADGFGGGKGNGHILLSHTHWGHIQGIPFCLPMLISGNHFSIYGNGGSADSLADLLLEQMDSYYCPVPNFFDDKIGALLSIQEIDEVEFDIGDTRVTTRRVNHVPDTVCLGFRLENGESTVAYIPDVEYLDEGHREPALALAAQADLLIHDAHHTVSEYADRRGCGHGCDSDAVEIARRAGARRLVLFHHHPDRTDDDIDALVSSRSSCDFPVEAAREGAEYEL